MIAPITFSAIFINMKGFTSYASDAAIKARLLLSVEKLIAVDNIELNTVYTPREFQTVQIALPYCCLF